MLGSIFYVWDVIIEKPSWTMQGSTLAQAKVYGWWGKKIKIIEATLAYTKVDQRAFHVNQ